MQVSELREQPDRSGLDPTVEFEYPADPLSNKIRDHFLSRFGGDISEADARWLAGLVADFLRQEPAIVSQNEFRMVAERFVEVLCAIDSEMSRHRTSRTWKQVALTFGLPSTLERGYTQAEIGLESGVCKMAISKRMHRLAASVGLEPAFKQSGQFVTCNIRKFMALPHMPLYVGIVSLADDGPRLVCYVGFSPGLCNAAIQAERDQGRADAWSIVIDQWPVYTTTVPA